MAELYTNDYYAYQDTPATAYDRFRAFLYGKCALARRPQASASYSGTKADVRDSVPLQRLPMWPWRTECARVPAYVQGGKLVDVGCARGDYLLLMRKLGWKTFGVELSSEAAEQANDKHGLQVTAG